ncbi:LLM class F420-dependent oxidoreductase [Blastococcus saxobsidens]|uniref:Putative Flavin-dependent oxidoreductase, F420-dependent methylene-tetrahydromethanopterin reductase n=1 Tax=Blastococcus saxobsidens (strain DD2) TaxID=1146883 RepID=H6RU08_BLASD|nr:LLM class F420-dependent oxidoreductase [Blastococcus saxobsidens]CCG04418.1 putative Flavin-dependent oxidoreductase, F420-dependent methylene-tetrahydromethanopterin reductase [Blastococcus saxobsidens DD2]
MRIGMPISYSGGFDRTTAVITDYESAGLDIVFVAEAYSFDAVSHLGYLAGRTTTVEIASGILNIYSRTPALLAMTAAGLDYVSGGRFTLGIGASGPQVIEGFHGVPYTAPLATTREVVDVCRAVWRREKLDHHGRHIDVPLTPERGGSGLGKPLKLINEPVRPRIPMLLAAIGPKNVALAAELFEAWQPAFFLPEGSATAFGAALAEGVTRRDPDLGPLQVVADTHLLITDDADEQATALDQVRAQLALYVGGMGARGKNFYNDLAVRYGYAEEAATVQDLYLDGRKDAAAAALPEDFVRGVALVGPRGHVAERVAAFREAGVTTLNARPLAAEHADRLRSIELLKSLA